MSALQPYIDKVKSLIDPIYAKATESKRNKIISSVIAVALVYWLFFSGPSVPQMPPPNVQVATVMQRDVPVFQELVGQIKGSNDVPIRARVEGEVLSLHFSEGGKVDRGQLLYRIDARPFEAKLVEAKSRLAEAKTLLVKAESDLARIKPLAEINAVSQRDLDSAVAQEGAARASVEAAEAGVNYAEVELSYTEIRAPIDGIIGLTQAKVGDFVGRDPNPVVLNLVSQIDPVLVRVTISENLYKTLTDRFGDRIKDILENPERKREEQAKPLQLIQTDGEVFPHEGHFTVLNAQFDPTTGTLAMEAEFPNPGYILRPGQFGRIMAVMDQVPDAILVPQRSIQELQSQKRVFRIDENNKAEAVFIETGPRLENLIVVNKGLNPNDRVVIEGIQKVQSGVTVVPTETQIALNSETKQEPTKDQEPEKAAG